MGSAEHSLYLSQSSAPDWFLLPTHGSTWLEAPDFPQMGELDLMLSAKFPGPLCPDSPFMRLPLILAG